MSKAGRPKADIKKEKVVSIRMKRRIMQKLRDMRKPLKRPLHK